MSRSNQIYSITVLNWEKHNPKAKSIYKKTLISNNFLGDAKIRQLSPGGKLLFLSCLLVSGESGHSQIEVSHDSLCFQSGVKSGSIQSQLDLLQSLQLLTWSKNTSLIKERKKEKKEVKENNNQRSENMGADSTQSANAVDVVVHKPLKNKFLYKITPTKEVQINQDLLASWQDQYPKEFLEQSLKDMRSWLLANEHKAPKSAWGKFMNGWFTRGWERYRTTLKSEPKKMSYEEFEEIMKKESVL